MLTYYYVLSLPAGWTDNNDLVDHLLAHASHTRTRSMSCQEELGFLSSLFNLNWV